MFARIILAVVVVGLGCQPESFHSELRSGPGPGAAGASGAAGVGIMMITVPGGMGGSDLAGAGGGGVLAGQAGVGGAAGLAGQAGAAGVAGVMGGTAGVRGGAAGAGGSAVDAGAGRNGGTGGGVQDAGVEAQPTAAYMPAQWKATASITAGGNNVPANAFDGKPTTRWTTGGNQVGNESFVIDLGKIESVSRVVLDDSQFANDFPVGYTLEVSTNGNTFTMVNMGMGATITSMDFTRTMARTLRIKQTGKTAANGSWWSIAELSIYP